MGEIQEPILITGAARSGTSLVAGVIHLCGAWGGVMRGPTKYNRKGMFENKAIVNDLVKPFFAGIGADPLGQNPLPDVKLLLDAMEQPLLKYLGEAVNLVYLGSKWRMEVLTIIKRQGYKGGPWFYKGAKMCLMWPLWNVAFPKAKWIIVRRFSEDIVRSCFKTSFMRGYKNRSGWLSWVAEHEKRFEEMINAKLDIFEVWPQRAIDGDLTELQIVVNSLGLRWDYGKVREFISPSLWHGKGKRKT